MNVMSKEVISKEVIRQVVSLIFEKFGNQCEPVISDFLIAMNDGDGKDWINYHFKIDL